MPIVAGGLLVEINEVLGRIWTILVAPVMIILALLFGYPYSPNLLTTIFSSLYIIGFPPLIALGIITAFTLSRHDMLWRTIAYGWIALAYTVMGELLSLIINPHVGMGFLCNIIVSDLGMVVSMYLIFSGLIMFINSYFSGKAGTAISLLALSPVYAAIVLSIILYFMPIIFYLLGYKPVPIATLESRSALVIDFVGWFVTFILVYELFRILKRTIFPEIVSILLVSNILIVSYFYIDFIGEFYHYSFIASLFIISGAFILSLISILIILHFIHNIMMFLKPIYRSIKREIGGSKSALIEYGLLDPYRTRTMLLLLMNRLLREIGDADTMIYMGYIGSPHIDIMRNLALLNRLGFITVYILRGIGYPRYDPAYEAYVTTLDPNLLRLVYEKLAGKKNIIVIDNLSHFIILYGVEKVYTILSEFMKFVRGKDLVIMLMNREMHSSKELAYARNLTTNIIGLP